jgi:hypothetical protein
MSLVKPKDGAKHDVLFNKPASDMALLNIKVRLKQWNQTVTKIMAKNDVNLVTPEAAVKRELLLKKQLVYNVSNGLTRSFL